MKKYIHFGSDTYDPGLVTEVQKQTIRLKPDKGLWGSPVSSHFGWKDWCLDERFRLDTFDKYFMFRIDKKAKILRIHREEDILPFIIKDELALHFQLTSILDKLDRDKIYSKFDGMELYIADNWSMHDGMFYTWDCDSICVWNPDVILPMRKEET